MAYIYKILHRHDSTRTARHSNRWLRPPTHLGKFQAQFRALQRQIEGFSNLPYHERLQRLNLYSVKGRLLRADLIKCWKIFHGECGIQPTDIFVMAPALGTRGHRFKILLPHCSTEARKRYFTVRCISPWNSLPDSVVALDTVHAFKSALHTYLGQRLFQYD